MNDFTVIEDCYLKKITKIEAEIVELSDRLLKSSQNNAAIMIQNMELKAELDQCLTVHAELNDKYQALKDKLNHS
jgi:Mg2+ and Co2+ transporter CorA